MKKNRIDRINSLLREVISDVIQREVKNPHITTFVSVARVDTSTDLHHAKVYISLIGSVDEKKKVLAALESAAGFIAVNSSKKVDLRHFPTLSFRIDDSAEKHFQIEKILTDIELERASRSNDD